jgi:hypothetical protein
LEVLEDRLAPATLLVNTTDDNTTSDQFLSLREAILLVDHGGDAMAALGRSLTAGEMAQVFGSGSYDSYDTVKFDPSLKDRTITLTSGELYLSRNMSISGPGASHLTISGNNASRVFEIASGTTVSLSGLTIAHGNSGTLDGGGIYNNGGALTVSYSTVTNNSAPNLSSPDSFGRGGGIKNDAGTLTVSNSTFTNNSAYHGGGIENDAGTLTVSNSTLADNSARAGAGICNSVGTLTVDKSALASNSGEDGAGIYNDGGTLTVSNSTCANNHGVEGVGIYNSGGTLTLSNSTLSGNHAEGSDFGGGGIYNEVGGTVTARNTILAGNDGPAYVGSPDLYGAVKSLGNNLFGSRTGVSFIASDLLNVNPLLGPLQDNGGPTPTMALLLGSPAIDAGDNTNAPATDQRGFSRVSNGTIDIGAYEVQHYAVTTTNDNGPGSLRDALNNANQAPGSIITFNLSGTMNTINLASALPDISRSVGVLGPGANQLTVRRGTSGSYRIFTVDRGTIVTLSGLTIANGLSSIGGGGGIYNDGATLTVSSSVLSGNSAAGGGGIYNHLGTLTVSNSTLSNNSAFEGGGIENDGGTLTVSNSTLSGNSAGGGGIINPSGSVTLRNSTVANNVAGVGGGIDNLGTLTAFDTILAGNTAPTGPDLSGALMSQGHNLFGNTSGGSITKASGDLLNVNPMLGPLQNNGGPTPTMALPLGSPAIDAGDNINVPIFDQRGTGFPRIVNGTIDIGAFEFQGITLAAARSNKEQTIMTIPFAAPLAVTISSPCGEPVQGGVVTFTAPGSSARAPSRARLAPGSTPPA